MNKDNLASIITRLKFCSDTKLEQIDDWAKFKSQLLNLNDFEFIKKLNEFGLLDKEAS